MGPSSLNGGYHQCCWTNSHLKQSILIITIQWTDQDLQDHRGSDPHFQYLLVCFKCALLPPQYITEICGFHIRNPRLLFSWDGLQQRFDVGLAFMGINEFSYGCIPIHILLVCIFIVLWWFCCILNWTISDKTLWSCLGNLL